MPTAVALTLAFGLAWFITGNAHCGALCLSFALVIGMIYLDEWLRDLPPKED
ncbi:hypothetical protein [Brevundimonas phage AA]|uniref:Uncharacterized protein n=1 Tax=Brevundimonas phage AA TaxID=2880937 RepID=A0AAN0KK22_9CAUD|nr:hypothetical protein [Brevundimonas phage BC]UCR90857.1 hypothetical protein [Brevundimonas phage AA]